MFFVKKSTGIAALALASFCTAFADTENPPATDGATLPPEAVVPTQPVVPPLPANIAAREVRYSYLGTGVEPLPAASYCESARPGIQVVYVPKDSPAAVAGISAGDILLTLDGQKIFFPNQLSALVRSYEPGASVEIELLRGTEKLTKTVVLGERVIAVPEKKPAGARDDVRIYINGREISLADAADSGGWISMTPNGILIRDQLDIPAEFRQLVSRVRAKIPDTHRTLTFLRQQYDEARKAALGKAHSTFSQFFYGHGNTVVIVGSDDSREITVSRADDGKVLFHGSCATQAEIDAIPDDARKIIESFTTLKPVLPTPPPLDDAAPAPDGEIPPPPPPHDA